MRGATRLVAALAIETGIAPQFLLDPEVSDVVDEMLDLFLEADEQRQRDELRRTLRGGGA